MAGAITAATAAVVSAGVGVYGAMQSGKAAHAQQQSAQNQLDFEKQLYSDQGQYRDLLSKLISDPSSISKLPGFQFQLDTGVEALKRAFGSMPGGAEEASLMKYGIGLAEGSFMDYAKLLASISGIEQNPAAYGQVNVGAGGNAISGAGQSFDAWSSALRGMAGLPKQLTNAYDQWTAPPSVINQPTLDAGGGYIWNNPAFPGLQSGTGGQP